MSACVQYVSVSKCVCLFILCTSLTFFLTHQRVTRTLAEPSDEVYSPKVCVLRRWLILKFTPGGQAAETCESSSKTQVSEFWSWGSIMTPVLTFRHFPTDIYLVFYSYCLCFHYLEGGDEPVKVCDLGDGVYECNYYPVFPGKYTVIITWGGHAIPRR